MAPKIKLTKSEARSFLVKAHFLSGDKLPSGKKSIVKVLKHLQAVQVDSIDVCGTNQEIIFNSRIQDFLPDHLYDALYGKKRVAYEGWSKCLCILPLESYPYYQANMRERMKLHRNFLKEHRKTIDWMLKQIDENGPMGSTDFEHAEKVPGWWSDEERLVKRALEVLWEIGLVMIHHRKRRVRFYDLTERCIRVPGDRLTMRDYELRGISDRLHAMRLFRDNALSWNLWQGIRHDSKEIFHGLVDDGTVIPVEIEGAKRKYFMLKKDRKFLRKQDESEKTVRLLAPLDSIQWDRELVRDLFGFEAKFEIYHPPKKRRWGYYCLPILFGTELVGRVDPARDRKVGKLAAHSIHWEPGIDVTDELAVKFADALTDHVRFLQMDGFILPRKKFDGKPVIKKHVCR